MGVSCSISVDRASSRTSDIDLWLALFFGRFRVEAVQRKHKVIATR
jgi:hypothetical protein